jgi:outer membrane protein assembly factor BamE (lipoprotein component of BamABCDE complex)
MKKAAMSGHSPNKRGYDPFRTLIFAFMTSAIIFSAGCATVGHDFPVDQVKQIQIGQTTKEEIRTMFGEPWRVGLEDGLETWSYGQYKYQMFSEKDAKDLVVRFAGDEVVESYTFNTTNP